MRNEFVPFKGRVVAHHDPVGGRVQFDDIQRPGGGDAQAFALANCIELDSVVVTQHRALDVNNLAAMLLHQPGLLQESAIIVVRHETNLRALFFIGRLEFAMAGDFPRVGFGFVPKRKQGASQLVLA